MTAHVIPFPAPARQSSFPAIGEHAARERRKARIRDLVAGLLGSHLKCDPSDRPSTDRYIAADLHGEALILRGQDAARYVLAQLLEEA